MSAGRTDYLDVEYDHNAKFANPWVFKMTATEKLLFALPAVNFADIVMKFKVANWPEDCMEPGNASVMLDIDKFLDDPRKGVV